MATHLSAHHPHSVNIRTAAALRHISTSQPSTGREDSLTTLEKGTPPHRGMNSQFWDRLFPQNGFYWCCFFFLLFHTAELMYDSSRRALNFYVPRTRTLRHKKSPVIYASTTTTGTTSLQPIQVVTDRAQIFLGSLTPLRGFFFWAQPSTSDRSRFASRRPQTPTTQWWLPTSGCGHCRQHHRLRFDVEK